MTREVGGASERDADAPSVTEPTSGELLRAIVDHIGHPVFVKDRAFRLVLVNPAFLALVGRSHESVLGRTDYDLFPREQAEFFRGVDLRVYEHAESIVIDEESMTDHGGDMHILRTVKEPVRDVRTGEITHLVGIITDVTSIKRAEQALRDTNEELERRVRERSNALEAVQTELLRKERLSVLGQLAASVAHQIRNPLAAIATASAILRRKLAATDDPDITQSITAILEEVWGANRIITELLDYARVKAPMVKRVGVEELIESALAATSPPSTVTIEREVDEALVVEVDPRQAGDAIASVIRNAYEAMPSGGRLRLSAYDDGDAVLVAIEDTGPGLTRDAIKGLFEPLVTSKPLGLGLGLATARLLLENQKGSIRAATQGGGGARFEIRLPRVR